MTVIYRLPTGGYPKWHPDQCDAVHAWLEAHGVDHALVPIDTDVAIVIDEVPSGARWLELPVLVRDGNGVLFDPDAGKVVRNHVRVPLVQDPPAALDQWAASGKGVVMPVSSRLVTYGEEI